MREVIMAKVLRPIVILLLFVCLLPFSAGATFSIVAVDPATGAVGGAGASCIDNCQIINDIIEGIGAVHTQAYYLSQNQATAHARLLAGDTPDQIITYVTTHDYEGSPEYRQYGAVTLAGPGASAGYSGALNTHWAGHLAGPGYSIQGNILLDSTIVYNMRDAFVNTTGPLENKLMAALEAANVPGADSRCLYYDKPAISAFIKVVHIGDAGNPYLYQLVPSTAISQNPIDSLRVLYDAWEVSRYADSNLSTVSAAPAVLPPSSFFNSTITVRPLNSTGQPPIFGAVVTIAHTGAGLLSDVTDNGDGTFSAVMTAPYAHGTDTIKATVTAGGRAAELSTRPVLIYYMCGDVTGDWNINIKDITWLINYLYRSGPPPAPVSRGDVNADGPVNIKDITYLINCLYRNGPDPICI